MNSISLITLLYISITYNVNFMDRAYALINHHEEEPNFFSSYFDYDFKGFG